MSIEKQKILNEIETLPEELVKQVIDFIEYLKFSKISIEIPENLKIKSKDDLKNKLQEGIDDIENGRVYSLEETFQKLDTIINTNLFNK